MTETARMKNPINPFEAYEFKEEDELADMAVQKFAPKFGYNQTLDVSRTDIQSEEIDARLYGSAGVGDYNRNAAGSFTRVGTEDFAKETPELRHVLHSDFKSHEQAADIKSEIESDGVFARVGCGSSLDATVPLEDDLDISFPVSSCNDRSDGMASDADESMSERSPAAIANNTASSDGRSYDNCSGDCNLGDESVEIVFYPDYIDYCGTHYLDSVVSFSRSFVEARSKTMYGKERSFQIHLEVEDIVKIESQWNAGYEAGIINIYFISNGMQDEIIHNASGLRELKFPAFDSNWYQKQEAIESLDVRYKALWNVLLDTGMEKISPLPEDEAMMLTRSYFPKFDKPFEEVIYPKGDPDAVSLSKRDVDLLLPDTFVNDTIIDFYIKYLKSRLNVDERTKFHFFNSFFFRKLADMDKDPSSAFDGKAAFQRVRKWTRKINLLEKDFIFIPVNYNLHWSLLVICYFGEVARYRDVKDGKPLRVPCILHMDSLRGNHVGLKGLLQSYLWEEWKERQKGTSEDLYSNFRNLKFIPLELPQQQNSYDCGLFLLHYVELFLEEVPANFSVYKITSSSKFLQEDWFPPGEASMKRTRIERLISDLLDTQSEDSPEGPNVTHGYDNGVECSSKPSPLSGCHESSLCQVDHGIEMTLLPASSIQSTQCTGTSGLVLKELLKQASASESLNDAPWGALGGRTSLHEFKRPVPLTEEVVEANECFVQQELTQPVFDHINSVFDHMNSSENFKLNSIHQPMLYDDELSPVTSGSDTDDILEVEADDEKWQSVEEAVIQNDELDNNHRCLSPEKIKCSAVCSDFSSGVLLDCENSGTPVDINDPDPDGNPLSLEFCQEGAQLHNHDGSHEGLVVGPTFTSFDKLDLSESVIPYDEARPSNDGHELDLESDENRAAKRMRIEPPDSGEEEVANNLLEDLNL